MEACKTKLKNNAYGTIRESIQIGEKEIAQNGNWIDARTEAPTSGRARPKEKTWKNDDSS